MYNDPKCSEKNRRDYIKSVIFKRKNKHFCNCVWPRWFRQAAGSYCSGSWAVLHRRCSWRRCVTTWVVPAPAVGWVSSRHRRHSARSPRTAPCSSCPAVPDTRLSTPSIYASTTNLGTGCVATPGGRPTHSCRAHSLTVVASWRQCEHPVNTWFLERTHPAHYRKHQLDRFSRFCTFCLKSSSAFSDFRTWKRLLRSISPIYFHAIQRKKVKSGNHVVRVHYWLTTMTLLRSWSEKTRFYFLNKKR